MKILCTHPGRYGDILWALPTVRALSEAYEQPVEFLTSPRYAPICPLIAQQPYIAAADEAVEWAIQESAPITPQQPPWSGASDMYTFDAVYHLGYTAWPRPTLAQDVYDRALRQHRTRAAIPPLDLATPWITATNMIMPRAEQPRVWLGWSEEHFELKVGLTLLLAARFPDVEFWWIRPDLQSRYDEADHRYPSLAGWQHMLGYNVTMIRANWQTTAALAQSCWCYLGCLSAPWVLANALGIPCVVMEPNRDRHHPVFWSDGGGGRNVLVEGNDGQPTWDARHTGDALESVLRGLT